MEFWKDLLQLGTQVSGYVNGPLGVILLVGGVLWFAFGRYRKWIQRYQNAPDSPSKRRWKLRLRRLMHALPIIGIIVGGFLFVGSIAWVLADVRRANEELGQTLSRYVLPRHLSEQQIDTIGTYLAQFPPQTASMTVVKNSEEANSYRADFQRAVEKGGWTITSIKYDDDIPEGITAYFLQTMSSQASQNDPKKPNIEAIFARALSQAKIRPFSTGGGSHIDYKENSFDIRVGRRRMDDGDLIAKKQRKERLQKMLDDDAE
jgi:hypothetical protein